MKRNALYILSLFLIIISCHTEDAQSETMESRFNGQEPLSAKQINEQINISIKNSGSFNWDKASDHLVWSSIFQGNKIASIGFGSSFDRKLSRDHDKLQNEILELIEKHEGKSKEKILIASDQFINQMDVIFEKKETLIALRHMKGIRYVEPGDYHYFENEKKFNKNISKFTEPGCGFDITPLTPTDYTTAMPNVKIPWSFYQHNIPSAWDHSTGSGITIGLIDSGISPEQSLLGADFNNGYSTGRTINKHGVYVNSLLPWSTGFDGENDKCGHGTRMASVIAAPRNNKGMPVGVAYNANLISYRASSNVVLDTYHEQNGVKIAFTELANNSDVKIISMSMGYFFSIGKVKDGVEYAYSKGKLIFCAGGTSTAFTNFTGVIFPASMTQVQAITGVKEGTSNQKCTICHSGSQIDFTYQMERSSGSTVPTLSFYNDKTDYVGGSSVATASVAGIAALVWSKHPSWTRENVIDKMRQSAFYSNSPDPNYGYGNINVLSAVQ